MPKSPPRLVYGPGAALVPHDVLWYADVPKRHALAERAANLGQRQGQGSERRLLFVDWPVLDKHKRGLLPLLDRFLDLSDPAKPLSVDGDALRSSLQALGRQPFRVRPTFLPGPWGGRWLLDDLGVDEDAPNLAWSYELITPESGVLLDDLEVGFERPLYDLLAGQTKSVLVKLKKGEEKKLEGVKSFRALAVAVGREPGDLLLSGSAEITIKP